MNEKEAKELLEKCTPKWRTRYVNNNLQIKTILDNIYPDVDLNIKIQAFLQEKSPYCVICSKPLKMLRNITCSKKCMKEYVSNNSEYYTKLKQDGMVKKYGVPNIGHLKSTTEKRHKTMLEKYGALVSDKARESARDRSQSLNLKARETLKQKYGIDNPGKLPDHREKCISTLISNYGVDNYHKSDKFNEESKKTWEQIANDKVDVTDIVNNEQCSLKRITFLCKTCNKKETVSTGAFKWRIDNINSPCANCAGIKHGSLKESKVREFIQNELNIKIETNTRILNGLELDIYCPEYNIGVEFNGLYWHNDLLIDKNYHLNKTRVAESKNIKLIHIFEDEWDMNENIVKSRLKNLFNKLHNKIHARKCEIKIVDFNTEKQFLIDNHIQGWAMSSIRIGLFFENELVSLMTFSRPSKAKGQTSKEGKWELLRFCNKINYTVVGGASKLLKEFIIKYNPLEIISFADRRWSQGNLYRQIGFVFNGNTPINYWYVKKGLRIHRFSLRKNSNDDANFTEYENRLKQGYHRIWDCGSSKWVWTKPI